MASTLSLLLPTANVRLLRARRVSAFQVLLREFEPGGWFARFSSTCGIQSAGGFARFYVATHVRVVVQEVLTSEERRPVASCEALHLLAEVAAALTESWMQQLEVPPAPGKRQTSEYTVAAVLQQTLASSTRAGLWTLGLLLQRHGNCRWRRARSLELYRNEETTVGESLFIASAYLGLDSHVDTLLHTLGPRIIPGPPFLQARLATSLASTASKSTLTLTGKYGLNFEALAMPSVVILVRRHGPAFAESLGVDAKRVARAAASRTRATPRLVAAALECRPRS